jgi:hypothetical protein
MPKKVLISCNKTAYDLLDRLDLRAMQLADVYSRPSATNIWQPAHLVIEELMAPPMLYQLPTTK